MKALSLLAVTPAVVLAACGYTPMYVPPTGESPARAQVTLGRVAMLNPVIQAGERRPAQEVARELHRYFPATNPNLDVLNVNIVEERNTLAVQRNATVAREEVELEGRIQILGADGESKLVTRLVSRVGYNVEDTPFSTESGQNYARLTAAKNLAEEIARRVVLYYRQPAELNNRTPTENEAESPE